MKTSFYHKILSCVLALALMCNTGVSTVLASATEVTPIVGASGICPHHAHNDECGYNEGNPCTFTRADCPECTPAQDKPADVEAATTVTGFAPLDEGVQQQAVTAGTELASLTLPDTLAATGHTAADPDTAAELTIEGVAWELDPANPVNDGNSSYDPAQGSYAFTPVLPEGYTVAPGTPLPEIQVMVGPAKTTAIGDVFLVVNKEGYNLWYDVLTVSDGTNPGTVAVSGENGISGADLTIPETVTNGDITYTVTQIKMSAFTGAALTGKLTIPGSVTSIGERAFVNRGFTGILTIPDSVTGIGESAFGGCTGFTGLTLGSKLETIGMSAFNGCIGFTGSLTIPDSVTTIASTAFIGCGFTGSLTIPDSVTTIKEQAFKDCKGFTELTLGSASSKLETIGDSAFYNNVSLDGIVTIPKSVKTIGATAFYKDSAIDKFYFSGDPPTIAPTSFSNTTAQFHYPASKTEAWAATTTINGKTLTPFSLLQTNSLRVLYGNIEPAIGLTTNYPGYSAEEPTAKPTWTSSDEAVATVDANGAVTGVRPGTATITATTKLYSEDCIVTVTGADSAGTVTITNAKGEAIPASGAMPGMAINIKLQVAPATLAGRSAFAVEQQVQFYAGTADPANKIGEPVGIGADGTASVTYTIPDAKDTTDLVITAEYGVTQLDGKYLKEGSAVATQAMFQPTNGGVTANSGLAPFLFANGNAITLEASGSYTSVYYDNDKTHTPIRFSALAGSNWDKKNGSYDLHSCVVFGGSKAEECNDTSITMTGGEVAIIYGGGSTANVTGSTTVTVTGGTVAAEVYGGGYNSNVSGNANVTVSGSAVINGDVYGAGVSAKQSTPTGNVTGNVNVAVTGGTVNGKVYGGGSSTPECATPIVSGTKIGLVTLPGKADATTFNRLLHADTANTMTVVGTYTLSQSLTIPAGTTLTVPSGIRFVISNGVTLTIEEGAMLRIPASATVNNIGTIINSGVIDRVGELIGNAPTGDGKFSEYKTGVGTITVLDKDGKVLTDVVEGDEVTLKLTVSKPATRTVAANKAQFYFGTSSSGDPIGDANLTDNGDGTVTATSTATYIIPHGLNVGANAYFFAEYGISAAGMDGIGLVAGTASGSIGVAPMAKLVKTDGNEATHNNINSAIGDASYNGGGTITLLRDSTYRGTKTIIITNTVTLELDGKTLTTNSNLEFNDANGSLTIQDSKVGGKVINTADDGKAVAVNNGTLTVTSGSLEAPGANGNAILVSGGTANINGGSFTSGKSCLQANGGTANVNGGSFKGGYCGINVGGNGTVALKGGTYHMGSDSSVRVALGIATVDDMLAPGYVYYEGEAASGTVATTNINVFKTTVTVGGCVHVWNPWTASEDGSMTRTCTKNCKLTQAAAVKVTGGATTDYYPDIKSAIDGAPATGSTVTLLADITTTEEFVIKDKTLTLDLNGKLWEGIFAESGKSTLFIGTGANVTIKGSGTIRTIGEGASAVYLQGSATIEGGRFFVDGTDSMALCADEINKVNGRELSITGGEFFANVVIQNSDNVALSGGSYTNVKVEGTGITTVGGLLTTGYGYQKLDKTWVNDTSAAYLIDVKVVSCPGHEWSEWVVNTDNVTRKCKICNTEVVANHKLVAGEVTTYYNSFGDAIAKANEAGGTITVLHDSAYDANFGIFITNKVTLDLNGKTLTTASILITLDEAEAELTVMDSDPGKQGTLKNTKENSTTISVKAGTLTVESGSIEAVGGAVDVAGGKVNISGGSLKGDYVNLLVNGGTVSLTGGTFHESTYYNVQCGVAGKTVAYLLAPGYVYYEGTSASGTVADSSSNVLETTVTVGECTHVWSDWTGSGDNKTRSCAKCKNAEGTATTQTAVAKVTGGATTDYYPDIKSAIDGATATGSTVTLLTNVETTEEFMVMDKTFTLDLNDKTWEGKFAELGKSTLWIGNSSNITVKDSGSNGAITADGGSARAVFVQGSATIKDGSFSATGTDSRALYAYEVKETLGRTLTITGGSFWSTVFVQNSDNVALSGGSYEKVEVDATGTGITTVGGLLATGCGYRNNSIDSSAWVTNTAVTMLEKVIVQSCTSHVWGSWVVNGDNVTHKCNNCNTSEVASCKLVVGDVTTYYAEFWYAVDEANKTGGTITLLRDSSFESQASITGKVTLDLNGKTLSTTTAWIMLNAAEAELTVRDSDPGKLGMLKSTDEPNATIDVCAGTLTVESGKIEATSLAVNAIGGKVNISGGSLSGGTDSLYVGGGTVSLTGGTFHMGGISSISYGVEKPVTDLLAPGYVYYDGTTVVDGSSNSLNQTVTVGKCVHVWGDTWTETAGGATRPCTNGCKTADGTVTTQAATVKVTGGDTTNYYADIKSALVGAPATGSTVTLLGNVETTEEFEMQGKTLTLDLNGKTWEGKFAKSSQSTLIINDGSNVTVTDSGSGGKITADGSYATAVLVGGTATIEGGSFSTNGYGSRALTAYLVNEADGRKLTITGGTFGSTVYVQYSDNVALSGGSYTNVMVDATGTGITTVGGLLATGCGYRSNTNGNWVSDTSVATLDNVSVQSCTSHVWGSWVVNGDNVTRKCNICNTEEVASSKVVVGGVTAYYTGFWDAAYEANKAGGTITLLCDSSYESPASITNKVTLDLNGKTLSTEFGIIRLDAAAAELTVRDSDPGKLGMLKSTGVYGSTAIQVKAGTLTVESGSIEATATAVSAVGGKVNVSGGSFKGDVRSLSISDAMPGTSGGTASLTGGTFHNGSFGSVSCVAAADDLLAPGYVYYEGEAASGTVVTGSLYVITTTVTVGECAHAWGSWTETAGVATRPCTKNCKLTQTAVAKVASGATTDYYPDVTSAFAAVASNETLTLMADVTEEVAISGKYFTLDLNGKDMTKKVSITGDTVTITGTGTVAELALAQGDDASLKGGTYTKLTCGEYSIGAALAKDYAFKGSNNAWVSGAATDVQTLENVTVMAAPFKFITYSQNVGVNYGYTTAPTLSVVVTAVGGNPDDPIIYKWYTYNGSTQLVESETGSVLTLPTGKDVGQYYYYCDISRDGYTKGTAAILEVKQSGTAFVGGIKTYKGATEQAAFTYGDTITVKVTPKATGLAPAGRSTLTPPTADQMALFIGAVQLTEAKAATAGAEVTFTIDTAAKQLLAGKNTITAKYVGNTSMADYSEDAEVTLNPKPITTATVAAGATKTYDGTKAFTSVALTGLTAGDILGSDIVTATASGNAASKDVGTSHAFTATGVTMGGAQGSYYSIATTAVSGNVAITQAAPTVSVTAAKKARSLLSTILGDHNDTITLTATTSGVNGEKPNGMVLFKVGTTSIAEKTTLDGVASYDWEKPNADSYTITAEFTSNDGNYTYTPVSDTTSFDIAKADQATLNIVGAPANVTYGDGTLALSATGGSGTGAVTFASSDSTVISISGSTATINKVGSVTITATKAGDSNFNPKTVTATVTVAPATPIVTFGTTIQVNTYNGSPVTVKTPPTVTLVNSETFTGDITYTYTDKAKLSNLFGLLAATTDELPTNAGSYTVTAHVAAFGNYAAANSKNTLTLTINKVTPTLAINTMSGKTYDGTAIAAPTAANMTITGAVYGDVEFSYSTTQNMTNPTATAPTNAGIYWVQASVAVGANNNAAKSTAVSFTIAPKTVTSPVIALEYDTVVYDGSEKKPNVLSVNDGTTAIPQTEYTVSYSGNTNVGTAATVTITDKDGGNYTVSGTKTFAITKKAQPALTITPVTGKKFSDGTFTLATTGGEGTGEVKYTIVSGDAVTISGSTATIAKAGDVTITATKDGGVNYQSVTSAPLTITIAKADQAALTIGEVTGKRYGDPKFNLATTGGTIAGAVTYTVPANDVLTLSGAEVTIVGVGTVTVTATMAGNGNYNEVKTTRDVTVAKGAAPTIAYPTASGLSYGQRLSDSTLTGGSTEYGSFAWTTPETVPTVNNSGYSVTFAPSEDTIKYYEPVASLTGNVAVTVAKATPAIGMTATVSGDTGARQAVLTAKFDSVGDGAVPTGTVKFVNSTVGSVDIPGATAVVVTNGIATFTWTGLADQVYNVTAIYSGEDNYNAVTTDGITFDTTKKNQDNFDIAAIGDKAYGDAAFTLTTTGGSGTGAISYAVVSGDAVTITGDTVTIAKTGSVVITATKAGDSTYNEAYASVSLTVAKRTVTFAADNKTVVKGQPMPTLTYSNTALAAGDTVTTEPTLTTTATDTNTVGTYPITIEGAEVSNGASYNLDYTSGTLTVKSGYTVSFNSNGGSVVADIPEVAHGATIASPADPTLSGYTFNGWYKDSELTTLWNFASDTVTADTTIYAKWTQNSSGSDSDDSGSGSGGSGSVAPEQPTPPTTAETKAPATVDKDGNATVAVPQKLVTDAIKTAQDAAKKTGDTGNGIAVVIDATSGKNAASIAATLSKTSVDALVAAGAKEVTIKSEAATITIDLATLKQLQATGGDVVISATRINSTALSKEAQAAVGNRPVFNLTLSSGGKPVTGFGNGSVSVSLPYTPAAGENLGNLCGVYVDGAGKVTYLSNSSYDANAKAMLFATNHFSTFSIGYKTGTPVFTDTASHWAKNDIDFAVSRGLLNGTGATVFSPNTGITRGELVTALGKLAGVDSTKYKNTRFTDVAATAYYAPYVAWAVEKGVMSGTGTSFLPSRIITRQEMAVLMQNYAKATGYTLPKVRAAVTFADAGLIEAIPRDAVKAIQMAGVMNGKDGNRFDPTAATTRAETAAMLRRYVELVIDIQTAQGLDVNDSGTIMMYEDGKAVKFANRVVGGNTYSFNSNGEATLLPKDKQSTTGNSAKG